MKNILLAVVAAISISMSTAAYAQEAEWQIAGGNFNDTIAQDLSLIEMSTLERNADEVTVLTATVMRNPVPVKDRMATTIKQTYDFNCSTMEYKARTEAYFDLDGSLIASEDLAPENWTAVNPNNNERYLIEAACGEKQSYLALGNDFDPAKNARDVIEKVMVSQDYDLVMHVN